MRARLSGIGVLEHDAALAGGEQVRLARHVHDVGVLEHRPVAGLAAHVLPVHRLGAAQLLEERVGRPVDIRVG